MGSSRYGEHGYGEGPYGGTSDPSDVGASGLEVIRVGHPCSVLGTGNNPDLLVNEPEAV